MATETKHTKGPWIVGDEGVSGGYANVYAEGPDVPLFVGTASAVDVGDEQAAANAHLFAAAPALLDALRELIAMCPCDSDTTPLFQDANDKAKAAIARALGA